uniref:Methionine synthase reductase n=1 Tax=Hirondellea gigas TaxID=1518452 RepID=A0A2P2I1Y2_9CRUS
MICKESWLLVLYASQQGNAKAIAEDLHEECSSHNIAATLYCISQLEKDPSILLSHNCTIFIAATTGDGEPPDTARKFWRSLYKRNTTAIAHSSSENKPQSVTTLQPLINEEQQNITDNLNSSSSSASQSSTETDEQLADKKILESNLSINAKDLTISSDNSKEIATTKSSSRVKESLSISAKFCSSVFSDLSALRYTVLGLGDTNYTNFCNFGKDLDERLHNLGAERFYPCGWADDGTGLEIVIEPWMEGIWSAVGAQLAAKKPEKKRSQKESTDYSTGDDNLPHKDTNYLQILEQPKADKVAIELTNVNKVKKADFADHFKSDPSINDDRKPIKFDNNNSAQNFDNSTKNDTRKDSHNESIVNEDLIDGIKQLKLSSVSRETFAFTIDNVWRDNHALLQLGLPIETKLTIPRINTYGSIEVQFYDSEFDSKDNRNQYQNGVPLPSADTELINSKILEFISLSKCEVGKEVKNALEVVLELNKDCEFKYQPGDTIGVLVHNNAEEVSMVLDVLGVTQPDRCCQLSKSPTAKKAVPVHLAHCSSLRELFTWCIDFRCVPKKAVLLHLYDCTTDPHERRCLQELISREGAEFYRTKILEARLSFFDLLTVFVSCRPKLSALLEILPRLLPRSYSLTSSPLAEKHRISFVFNLVVIPSSSNIFKQRHGLCTGELNRIYQDYLLRSSITSPQLRVYLRTSKTFRLPVDPSKPIILVGPGTGVAPLVGFLRHRQLALKQGQLILEQLGESWLFFGCRYSGLDELFSREIEEFKASGVLRHLHVCYSRDPKSEVRYVQHLISAESASLSQAIVCDDARVYVCGDAAGMAKDVHNAFSYILAQKLKSSQEGLKFITQMQKDKTYLQDVWT